MTRRIELGRNPIPALADHGCELAVALLDELDGVVVYRLEILRPPDHPPAAAGPRKNVGAVEDRGPSMQLRNDPGVGIAAHRFAGRQRERPGEFWGNMIRQRGRWHIHRLLRERKSVG